MIEVWGLVDFQSFREYAMPLPMKTLQEAAAELGMPEREIKAMVDLGKVRAVMKRGKLYFAPDELAKIKRLRKTIPESAKPAEAPAPPPPKPAAPPRPAPPPRRPPPPRRFGAN
ncbi:MAG: hypothetical protein JSS02_12305 [Planctomycetes bacterium]|nr:hypothetical protein [Planctomycetota bacterium]